MTFTTREVAKLLGITYEKALKLINTGKLTAYDTSTGERRPTWRVDQASIEDFKRKQSSSSANSLTPLTRQRRQPRRLPPVPNYLG